MPVKIALVFHGVHKRGGVERSIWEAARHWRHSHDVTIVAADIDRTDLDGVTIREVPAAAGSGPYSFGRAARRHYRLDEFDHVISFGVQPVPATIAWVGSVHRAWLEASRRFPDSGRLRHPLLRYLLRRHIERLVLERRYFRDPNWSLVVTVADAVGNDLTRLYDVDPALLRTVNNGFDPAEFDPSRRDIERDVMRAEWGVPPDAIVLCMVANELPRKGYDHALRAIAGAGDRRLHLVLAGTADPVRYARLTAELGLTGRTHYLGQQADIGRVHAGSDAFILPTKYEAFCMAIVEALASGLPVITTSVPGAGDLVQPDVNGLLLDDPEDSAALTTLVRRIADDEVRARLAAAARPSVDQLSWAEQFDRAIALFPEPTPIRR
jgi:UDP-glucose:(heptosyl)LPS alpha-1,3-glucosyltransferase